MPGETAPAEAGTNTDIGALVAEQLNILLTYLERPDVVWQLLLLLAIVVLSYILGVLSHRWLNLFAIRLVRGHSQQTRDLVLNRWLPAIDQLDWPIMTLVLLYVSIPLFGNQGREVGLLAYSTNFFWILLAYQMTLTVLYALLRRQAVQRYHKSIFAPAFGLGMTWAILSFLNIDAVLDLQLGRLFDTNITLGNFIGALIVLYIFIVVSRVVQDVMRAGFARFDSDPGLVNSVLTITRYLVIIFGIIFTLTTLGFNPATLAAIAGGLSLGAGLGLQGIISNFFSGVVLLLEQTIRPGDVVVIGTDMGTVKQINIRATTINRFDNVDLIIPNENLMTSTVTTYNTRAAKKRVEVRVGASYNSDPTLVRKVLEETAAKHGLVLDDPPPAAYFLSFGESSLDFVLWAWVADNDKRWGTQSDLHYMVAQAFQKNNIEIPFPQRDIHVRMPDPSTTDVMSGEGQAHFQQSQQGVTEEAEP